MLKWGIVFMIVGMGVGALATETAPTPVPPKQKAGKVAPPPRIAYDTYAWSAADEFAIMGKFALPACRGRQNGQHAPNEARAACEKTGKSAGSEHAGPAPEKLSTSVDGFSAP